MRNYFLAKHSIGLPNPTNSALAYKEQITTEDGGNCYSVAWNRHHLYIAAKFLLIKHDTMTGKKAVVEILEENTLSVKEQICEQASYTLHHINRAKLFTENSAMVSCPPAAYVDT